ncbi:MAG: DUF6029 family protein [Melioribacteraceae bacterium]|nr:DUF6029 family protein [Melioribacteraceae bacterium]MCF8265047.1 DUF6029 family protein [Melioribacteraceae bacterium]MCF8414394.1 DUF6029 family protein [Melioribacteraceae bacterium]MCF8430962.1 DUF6029 family protein [Melioribacteraceae bacterium]
MIKKILASIFLLAILPFSNLIAQFHPSLTTQVRYGNGEQSIVGIKSDLVYREIISDGRLGLPYNFTAGFRFLYDEPPEVGQKYTGLKRRFIEYNNSDLFVRLGNFSELYGKGLALNLFEERGLAYDTWMDGIKAKYEIAGLKISLLNGKIEYADSINYWREEDYHLTAANIEYEFNEYLNAGISFVSAKGELPSNFLPEVTETKSEIPEFYFGLTYKEFDFFFNYASKWTNVKNIETANGFAIYSSLSYSGDGLGIILDYKNYLFDEKDPYSRNDFERPSRMLPTQNPPIAQKEHSKLFLSRAIHEVDFNDEVGLQAEIYYALNEQIFLSLNASVSSRHNSFDLKPNGYEFEVAERSGNYLPSLQDQYSPYWEYYFEAEYSPDYFTSIKFGIAQRSKQLYNDFTGIAGSHKLESLIFPVYIQHIFNREISTTLQYEFESVEDNFNSAQPEYANHFVSTLWSLYSKLNVSLRYEYSTNEYDLSERQDWFTFEAGYRINQQNTISFSVGRERGGQTCSNGVCRYIQPFSGFRMNLISTIN